MPHFHIDYAPRLEEHLDIFGLCVALRDAAVETGLFPLAGIRIRATPAKFVVMADGNPDHMYLDLSIRLREGRAQADKERATAHIFAAIEGFCGDVMSSAPFMLSLEMRDIDARLSPKASSIRRYLPAEAG